MGRQFGLKVWVFILRAGGSHGRNVSRAVIYANPFSMLMLPLENSLEEQGIQGARFGFESP